MSHCRPVNEGRVLLIAGNFWDSLRCGTVVPHQLDLDIFLPSTPNVGRQSRSRQVSLSDGRCGDTPRWVVGLNHSQGSATRIISEWPPGDRMALKDYSDNEAVRTRGQDLLSTKARIYIFKTSREEKKKTSLAGRGHTTRVKIVDKRCRLPTLN